MGWGNLCLTLLPVLGPNLAASSDESIKRQAGRELSALVSQCLHFKEKETGGSGKPQGLPKAALKWRCWGGPQSLESQACVGKGFLFLSLLPPLGSRASLSGQNSVVGLEPGILL